MPHPIIWSWYTGRWRVGCHIWYSEEGTGWGRNPPRPLLSVPNVTARPSTASVPITVLLYNGPLLCGFNVPYKGLRWASNKFDARRYTSAVHAIWQSVSYSCELSKCCTMLCNKCRLTKKPKVGKVPCVSYKFCVCIYTHCVPKKHVTTFLVISCLM